MKFILEQSPAETTAYRFARLDLKYFSPAAGRYVKGDIAEGAIYYTNSTHLNVSADVALIAKSDSGRSFSSISGRRSNYTPAIGWLRIRKRRIKQDLYKTCFTKPSTVRLDFSPEFTSCLSCGKTAAGLNEECIYCGSTEVEGIARLTKYFSKISSWNKGKLAELKNRSINKFI